MPAQRAEPRAAAACLLLLLLGSPLAAQTPSAAAPQPIVRIALAPDAMRAQLPALAELCERHLPQRVGAVPTDAFGLELQDGTLRQFPTAARLPAGIVATGSCRFGAGEPLLWSTAQDGTEDWYVPADFALPAAWSSLLHAANATALDTPMTLSAAVVTAHLAGAMAEGDPRADLLLQLAATCGEVTWLAWREGATLRVRGRSDGGLALPATLALLAGAPPPTLAPRSLRAFGARDAHRNEAARQLLRGDDAVSIPVLRALLHAEDETALAAIDALVRLGATDELPRIVAAATPARPAAALAALHAVQSLWTLASPQIRQQTRGAIARSGDLHLRGLDLAKLDGTPPATLPAEPTLDDRGRALLWLSLTAIGLCGLWLRERQRPGELPA